MPQAMDEQSLKAIKGTTPGGVLRDVRAMKKERRQEAVAGDQADGVIRDVIHLNAETLFLIYRLN